VTNPLGSLPIVPETALPASVRGGSPQDQKDYRTALGFEQVLLGQLVQEMVPDDSELAQGPYADAVRDAFAQGITDAGGLGLGAQLFQTMQRTAK
jgi:hypothetical protein